MRVVLADVQRPALEAVAEELRAAGGEVLAVATDVSVADDVSALAERAEQEFGPIHVVCHNAGVFAAGLSWEAPLSDYAWVFDVNVWGVIHGVRAFTPLQLAHGDEGHIVITASMAALTSTPFCAPYVMSKHAVLALAETLHLELAAKKRGDRRLGAVPRGREHAHRASPTAIAPRITSAAGPRIPSAISSRAR